MAHQNTSNRRGFLGIFILILLITTSLYMMTYSGRMESTDAIRLFDAVSSQVHFGDWLLDESFWVLPRESIIHPLSMYPMNTYEISEPFAVEVASLFYRVSLLNDQWGAAQVTWLMNILISGLVAAAFAVYSRVLGYRLSTAVAGALLLGLATGVWIYSKLLFREPLVLLLLLVSAICLERWRQNYRSVGWLFAMAAGMVAAFYTKNSAVLALPAFVALLLLPRDWATAGRGGLVLDVLLVVGCGIGFLSIFSADIYLALWDIAMPVLDRLIDSSDPLVVRTALHSYLFSVGGSVWGTSPVLLLGLPGLWFLRKRGQRRLIAAIVLIVLGYAAGHALLTTIYWAGGLSWPPRFMIPVLPFAMLAVLPMLDYLRRAGWLARSLALGVGAYSVLIQIIGAISYTDAYVSLLPQEANRLSEWLPGYNQIAYLRWVLLPQSWDSLGFDIVWLRTDAGGYMIGFAGIAVAGSGLLVWQLYSQNIRRQRLVRYGLPLLVVAFMWLVGSGMELLYKTDAYYWAHKPALFDVLNVLQTEATDGEPLLLAGDASVTYERFMMNYLDSDAVRPIVTLFPPGEAVSNRDAAKIQSHYPPDLLDWYSPRAIAHLANNFERIWLLDHVSPFLSYSVRPMEQYLSRYHYPLRIVNTDDPTVRLLEFDTTQAPNRYLFDLPEILTTLRYGESIHLEGVTLPDGEVYARGDNVPVTFFWSADAPVLTDYVVAWFIGREGELPAVTALNSSPDAGFSPTSGWTADELIYDNRAVTLPQDMPVGEYDIWLVLYEADSGGEIRLPVTEGQALDETIGVLPITLRITE